MHEQKDQKSEAPKMGRPLIPPICCHDFLLLPSIMSRPTYTQCLLTAWLALFLSITAVHAHMIDVVAGKKECFFEDLHKQDKMTVTYQVGGGGHLDIDFWVRRLTSSTVVSHSSIYTANGPWWRRPRKASQAIYWLPFDNCRKRWTARILFLQSNERYCRQTCQVRVLCDISAFIFSTCLASSFNVHGVIYVGEDGSLTLTNLSSFLNSPQMSSHLLNEKFVC